MATPERPIVATSSGWWPLLLVVLVALLAACGGDQVVTADSNDIQSLLNSVLDGDGTSQLNLPDASATVGKLFTYRLGLNTQPVKYKVRTTFLGCKKYGRDVRPSVRRS